MILRRLHLLLIPPFVLALVAAALFGGFGFGPGYALALMLLQRITELGHRLARFA